MIANTLLVTLAVALALAAADVSDLASSYLPPSEMTIEKQELRELPEQIEYINNNMPQMATLNMPFNEMAKQEQMLLESMQSMHPPAEPLLQMPNPQYLAPDYQPMQDQQQLENNVNMEPSFSMKQDFGNMPAQEQRMLEGAYLPPSNSEMAQPTYQQYQEQLLREHQQQQQEQMQYDNQMLKMEQMMSIMPENSFADQAQMSLEPEAAHTLANDGYHYRDNNSRRLRLRH